MTVQAAQNLPIPGVQNTLRKSTDRISALQEFGIDLYELCIITILNEAITFSLLVYS